MVTMRRALAESCRCGAHGKIEPRAEHVRMRAAKRGSCFDRKAKR
jgi:hypothetical protein